ncbi:MAG: hypothetical protein J6Q22_09305 [Prevotella sp.]|nr:hypothetical protein [Prevotella sp.]
MNDIGSVFLVSLWICVIGMCLTVVFHHIADAFYLRNDKVANIMNEISKFSLAISVVFCLLVVLMSIASGV